MAKAKHSDITEIEDSLLKKGVRFTDQRRLVFDIIRKSRKPITAYDILAKMRRGDENPAPPTAYRAIDFLIQHGLIHKIESLNAFVSCHAGHNHAGSQFTVCDNCGDVAEIHLCDVPLPLQALMKQTGFQLSKWNAELHGICQDCQK